MEEHIVCEQTKYKNTSDEKAYQDIVDLIESSTAEKVLAMHRCAAGLVRFELEEAIRRQIVKGNKALSKQFPDLRK